MLGHGSQDDLDPPILDHRLLDIVIPSQSFGDTQGLFGNILGEKTKLFNKLSLPMTYRAILINHILVYKAVPNSIMMKAVYFCHEQD